VKLTSHLHLVPTKRLHGTDRRGHPIVNTCFVFRKSRVRIFVRRLAILKFFYGSSQQVQAYSGILGLPLNRPRLLLSATFQFTIHKSFCIRCYMTRAIQGSSLNKRRINQELLMFYLHSPISHIQLQLQIHL
jgi:hypothetical protein